jgi:ankyrin repeat protein
VYNFKSRIILARFQVHCHYAPVIQVVRKVLIGSVLSLLLFGCGGGKEEKTLVSPEVKAFLQAVKRCQSDRELGRDENIKHTTSMLEGNSALANAKDEDGKTALYYAARNGDKETVELLLEYNADVNAATEKGFTPLYWAVDYGHKDVVKLLLEGGADPNVMTFTGETPLHVSVTHVRGLPEKDLALYEIAALLIGHGADVNASTGSLGTPLHIASENGYTESAGAK